MRIESALFKSVNMQKMNIYKNFVYTNFKKMNIYFINFRSF